MQTAALFRRFAVRSCCRLFAGCSGRAKGKPKGRIFFLLHLLRSIAVRVSEQGYIIDHRAKMISRCLPLLASILGVTLGFQLRTPPAALQPKVLHAASRGHLGTPRAVSSSSATAGEKEEEQAAPSVQGRAKGPRLEENRLDWAKQVSERQGGNSSRRSRLVQMYVSFSLPSVNLQEQEGEEEEEEESRHVICWLRLPWVKKARCMACQMMLRLIYTRE